MHTEMEIWASRLVQRQLIPQSVILSRFASAAKVFELIQSNVSLCFNLRRNGFSLLCHLLHLELQISPEQHHPEWGRSAFAAARATARAATRAAAAAFETRQGYPPQVLILTRLDFMVGPQGRDTANHAVKFSAS